MTPQEVSAVRDASILLEHDNLNLAHKLMTIAQRERPDGKVINQKIGECRRREENDQRKLEKLIHSGSLAIISSGLRCHTRINLTKSIGLKQASLPFDSGFFPPSSIARLLKKRTVAFKFPDPYATTHQVCIKQEHVRHDNKNGIVFRSASYEEINAMAQDPEQPDINTLLDATFGYYTLDKTNGFVLAHYNWHPFAADKLSKGMRDPALNIPKINQTLNSRIQRMFDICDRAKKILFVAGNFEGYDDMKIDDDVHDLTNIDMIRDAVAQTFGDRAAVVHFKEINNPTRLLAHIA